MSASSNSCLSSSTISFPRALRHARIRWLSAATGIRTSGKIMTAAITGETFPIAGKWMVYDDASHLSPARIAHARIRRIACSVFCLIDSNEFWNHHSEAPNDIKLSGERSGSAPARC